MTITIPNITHGEELLSAFRKLPGNEDKTISSLYFFLENPTPERDSFYCSIHKAATLYKIEYRP